MIDWSGSDLVRELCVIENRFLQCLVTDFVLERQPSGGGHLTLQIDDHSPTVWLREGKEFVGSTIAAERTEPLQEELDEFLFHGKGTYQPFHEDRYCFRYGSGGTLPIVRRGGQDYYCLFYRDLFPIGWNLANGGTATKEELLSPLLAVERELREELIVIDPEQRRRYVFPSDRDQLLDRPAFAEVRRRLHDLLPRKKRVDYEDLLEEELPVIWLDGPDALTVKFGDNPGVRTDNCFVTITTEDFGIEIDRVAKLFIPDSACLFDGEVLNGEPLNRPVGLFQVEHMHQAILNPCDEFIPDIFFHGLTEYKGSEFCRFVDVTLVEQIRKMRDDRRLQAFLAFDRKYQLCPVTGQLISRQASLIPPARFLRSRDQRQQYQVFVSCGQGDEEVAEMVHHYVSEALRLPAYFYRKSARDPLFLGEIEHALSTARWFVAVASQPARLTRNYPNYERVVFTTRILNEAATRTAPIIPYVAFDLHDLPIGYAHYKGIQFDPRDPREKLTELRKFLDP